MPRIASVAVIKFISLNVLYGFNFEPPSLEEFIHLLSLDDIDLQKAHRELRDIILCPNPWTELWKKKNKYQFFAKCLLYAKVSLVFNEVFKVLNSVPSIPEIQPRPLVPEFH